MIRRLPLVALLSIAVVQAEDGLFESVVAEVEKIQSEANFRNASIGFCVIPLDADDPAAAAGGFNPDQALVPASTMKVITTATALEILGPDYRFQTVLEHTGKVTEDGVLHGSVIIRGGGDPTLGASQIVDTFTKWQAALTGAGIKKIDGQIIGDESIFGTKPIPDSWQWNDIGNYYGAGACGLTFHQNQFFCRFETGAAGDPANLLGTDPRLPGIQLINEMRTGPAGSGDQGYIYGFPFAKVFYLRGTVPAGGGTFTIKGSLPDPAFFCARAFTKHLNERDFPVSGEPTTVRLQEIDGGGTSGERQQLLVQDSDPLSRIAKVTNFKSNNLMAECIHRAIGVKLAGEGSTEAASLAITGHWAAKGIGMTGFAMDDGCGLARANTVTARQMAEILYRITKTETSGEFRATLPTAGRDGTLRGIGGGSPSEGRVHAKSGSLDRVKSYCGYVDGLSGKGYAFAIFINHHDAEAAAVKASVVRVWNRIVEL